jgi:parallel beta-helix repeat protein
VTAISENLFRIARLIDFRFQHYAWPCAASLSFAFRARFFSPLFQEYLIVKRLASPTFLLAVFLLIAGAVYTAAASAAELYVATNGSDENAGTQSAPLKTITKASEIATPGTTVHVAPGTYPGGFVTSASGTATARIRYVSDTKWGARFVPEAGSQRDKAWRNMGSYTDIVGFEIDGTNHQDGVKWLTGILSYGSNNLIEGNHVHHIAQAAEDCTSHGGSGINANNYYNGYHVDLIGNVVHDIGVAGCNHIHGLYMATSGDIKNNLVYRIGYGAIHLWHDASNNNIANNTVFHNFIGIIVGGGDFIHSTTRMADYVNVSNNIVIDNTVGAVESGIVGTHNTYVNNLVYQNSRYNFGSYNPPVGTIAADPQFRNYQPDGSGDYRLKISSPAMDAGDPTYAPATDIEGIKRPRGSGIDVGAYEFH